MIFKAIAGVIVLLVFMAIAGKVEGAVATNGPSLAPVGACEEDMACWDCTTMGNLICGPNVGSK